MKHRIAPPFQPRLEALEDRCTPSAVSHLIHALNGTADFSPAGRALAHPASMTGLVSHGHRGHHGHARVAEQGDTHTVAFRVSGGGTAPNGLPLFPGGTAPHNATGTGTELGRYTGDEGHFELLSIDPATGTGTFRGSFVFVAANGDRLAMDYGADPANPGRFTLTPAVGGKVVVTFVAVFTPDPALSTGRFARVTGGSFVMVATTEPFDPTPNAQGYTVPFAYTWSGAGSLTFSNGR
jgi:hypothetical protein